MQRIFSIKLNHKRKGSKRMKMRLKKWRMKLNKVRVKIRRRMPKK